MIVTRRHLLHAVAAAAVPGLSPLARAQGDWPTRPVRLVSPYGPGGANDVSARLLGEELARALGQPFVVENKPGAGTRLANEQVARAAADGYTVLYAAAPYATAQALHGKLAYDPQKDLAPVAMAVIAPIFLIVDAKSGFRTTQDLIAHGKAKPQGLTFGSPGAGSQPHLAAELLFRSAGVKGLNVHLRGDAMAYTELLGGRVDATLTAITSALPHIESGKLRVLGVASAERSALHPQAPTLREQGFDVVGAGWYGFMVPAATPSPIVDRLQREATRVLGDAEVRRRLLAQGLEARPGTAVEFGRFIETERVKWSEVIRGAGLKAD